MMKYRYKLLLLLTLLHFSINTSAQDFVSKLLQHSSNNKDSSNNYINRVVKSVSIGEFRFILYKSNNSKTIIQKTNINGIVLMKRLYTEVMPTNMTVINYNNKAELLVIGKNAYKNTGIILRINPNDLKVNSSGLINKTTAIYNAEQFHTKPNINFVALLAQSKITTSKLIIFNLKTNKIHTVLNATQEKDIIDSNYSYYGYGLAISQLNDNILLGLVNSGHSYLTFFKFNLVGKDKALKQTNIGASSTLKLSTAIYSSVDVMASIKGTDNVIFGYHQWNNQVTVITAGTGILEFNKNNYNVNYGNQQRYNYGINRRSFDISINPAGTEACIGTRNYLGTKNGNIGFQRIALKNGTFNKSKSDIYFGYKEIKGNYNGFGEAISNYDKKGNLFTTISLINSELCKVYNSADILPLNNTCYNKSKTFNINSNPVSSSSSLTINQKASISSYAKKSIVVETLYDCFINVCNSNTTSSKVITKNNSLFKIYPNPTNGLFNIDLTNMNITNIKIYNTLGRIIYKSNARLNKSIQINTQEWAKGIYIITLESKKDRQSSKIIIE